MARGPHPSDPKLFNASSIPDLRTAAQHLAWLLEHGYSEVASLKLVADRFKLQERQRNALRRGVCSFSVAQSRLKKRLSVSQLYHSDLLIDGFNCVIVLETGLAGGVLLAGLDGAYRDLASVYGNYRRTQTTELALDLICKCLVEQKLSSVTWVLDRPVSNSGRLGQWILNKQPKNIHWSVTLVENADKFLNESNKTIATADAWLLDQCSGWIDLPATIMNKHKPDDAWIVDLKDEV